MSIILSQKVLPIKNGNIVATEVKLTAASDTVDVPRMSSATAAAAQVRRPSDPAVTVAVSDIDTLTLTGSVNDEILVVTHSYSPIPTPSSG